MRGFLTSRKEENQEKASGIRSELLALIDGMDYCMDWKPDDSAWSVRQVLYHVLETPASGIHQVVRGMLSGESTEFEIWADLDNMTTERMAFDIEQIRADIEQFFHELAQAIDSADEEDFNAKSAVAHLRSRGADETRTVQELLDRVFEGHWRGHLTQIIELRDALGM